jgi:SAM-dependent methyltransferase
MSSYFVHLRWRARGAYLLVRRSLSAALMDRRWGIETSQEADLATLGLDDAHRVRYEPSSWWDLRRAMRVSDVHDDDVFLDLGSGKGRVVLQAAQYRFRRVIGVEISPQLTAVAERNLAKVRPHVRAGSVELVTADVVDYRIPDDVTVIYIYNAFRGPVFEAAIAQIIASVDRAPRRVRLIYRTALEHERLIAARRFRPTRVVRGLRPGRAWSAKLATRIYEVV